MSSALEEFRAQKRVVDHIHAQVKETAGRLSAIQAQIDAVATNPFLRELLRDERAWLDGMRRALAEVRAFREHEMTRFGPGVWRRWAVAVVFALAATAAFGAGNVWSNGACETEIASLRFRVEVLDAVAARILTRSPTERTQFDALMRLDGARSNRK